jgi:prepilin-type N-terminal cleavage/methylation domain-containing protein
MSEAAGSVPRGGAAPWRTRTPGRGIAGFTLLEVVLALVIFSLLTLMVYSAFFIGHRAVLKGERQADISQRVRLAEEIIARQLHSAVFYFGKQDEDSFPYFLGTADGLSFVTAAPQSRGGTGLAVVTYRVVRGSLVVEERMGFTPDDVWQPRDDLHVQQAVLLRDFSAMRFEYQPHEGQNEQNPNPEGSEWHPAWDGREEEAMPAAVRITVEGLEFFQFHPWVKDVPLMTVAYGWGSDEFEEPPEEADDAENADEVPGDQENGDFADQPNSGDAE